MRQDPLSPSSICDWIFRGVSLCGPYEGRASHWHHECHCVSCSEAFHDPLSYHLTLLLSTPSSLRFPESWRCYDVPLRLSTQHLLVLSSVTSLESLHQSPLAPEGSFLINTGAALSLTPWLQVLNISHALLFSLLRLWVDKWDYRLAPEMPWLELSSDKMKSGATGIAPGVSKSFSLVNGVSSEIPGKGGQ